MHNFFRLFTYIQATINLSSNRKKTDFFNPIKRTCDISNLLINSIILLREINYITVKMTMQKKKRLMKLIKLFKITGISIKSNFI